MGAVVFLGVEGFIVYSMFRYRRRDDRLPPQTHGNTLVEIIWTAIPTVIVLILFVLSVITLQKVEATSDPSAGGVNIEVDGFQWQWQFRYLDDDSNPDNDYSVVGSPAIATGDGGAGRGARAPDAHVTRRDPLLLRAAVPHQARPDPVPGGRHAEQAGVHGQRGGHLPRAVRRVLWRPPRPDDLQRAGHVARRVRPVAGGRQGRQHAAAVRSAERRGDRADRRQHRLRQARAPGRGRHAVHPALHQPGGHRPQRGHRRRRQQRGLPRPTT